MTKENQNTQSKPAGKALSAPLGSPSDTPETDILHDHCHIDNTPAPEAIETWATKCRKLERERNEARRECELWRGRFVDERIRFPWENSEVRRERSEFP